MSEAHFPTPIRPAWISPEALRDIIPFFERLGTDGGAVCILLESDPMQQNFPVVKVAAFNKRERQTIRAAILRQRKRKESATKA